MKLLSYKGLMHRGKGWLLEHRECSCMERVTKGSQPNYSHLARKEPWRGRGHQPYYSPALLRASHWLNPNGSLREKGPSRVLTAQFRSIERGKWKLCLVVRNQGELQGL